MTFPRRSGFLTLVCAIASLGYSLTASDWPQWQGPARDGCSAETALLKEWPEGGPRRVWVAPEIGKGYSSAAVCAGRIYTTGMTGTNEGVLTALNLDGKLLWKQAYGPEWTTPYPGARSTPTVHEGLVYVMSGMGRLACFDAASGDPKWQVDVQERFHGRPTGWGFAESVLIVGDKVICTPGGPDASLAALDRKTGQTGWTSRGLSERPAACTPVLIERGGTRLIVASLVRSTVGVDADTGKVLWTYNSTDPNHVEDAVNPNTPVYHDGAVLVPAVRQKGGAKLALSADGREITEAWTAANTISHHGGMLYHEGFVYLTSGAVWICADWRTGEANYKAPGIGKGTLIYAGGCLYCYGENGQLALVKAGPEGYQIVSRFVVTHGNGDHYAHLSLADGRLYVRHGDALAAYDIRGQGR